MNRQTVYRGEIPYETDFLYAQRFAYEAMGLLAADVLGTGTLVAGLACAPTSPASLQVQIAPGRIYSQQVLDATDWGVVNSIGGLVADTNADHKIMKQGLLRDTTALSCPAPSTSGYSINYLIQAAFSEADLGTTVLAFFNASNPSVPWAGPGNSGGTLPILRADQLVLTVKAGTAAATGSQATPSVDSGNVGLWVVTVANGATTITSGNIAKYGSAPFISETLLQKISTTTGDARYIQGQVQVGTFSATFAGPFASAQTCTVRYKKITVGGKGIVTLSIPKVVAAAAGVGSSQAQASAALPLSSPNLLPTDAAGSTLDSWSGSTGAWSNGGTPIFTPITFSIDNNGTMYIFNSGTWPTSGSNGWGAFTATYDTAS